MPFQAREERGHHKSRKPLTSSTNTRQSQSRKQKSYSRKQTGSFYVSESMMNRSTTTIDSKRDNDERLGRKSSNYEKYYRKQRKEEFPNISIIEQKESILSNNLENSLDSLNNFIFQANRPETSVIEKSNSVIEKSNEESSSLEQIVEWTRLQQEYQKLKDKGSSSKQENEYLQIISELKEMYQARAQSIDEGIASVQAIEQSPLSTIEQRIRALGHDISNVKHLSVKRQKTESSSEVIQNTVQNQSYQHQRSQEFRISKELNKKDDASAEREPEHQLSLSKLRIKVSQSSNKRQSHEQRLLEHLSEEENKFIQGSSPSVHEEEAEKAEDEFQKFIDKKYSQENLQNQPNLSLGNISKIMKVRPRQHHNKSIQNENQIKEKEDDYEVVAMLQNQLRGKEIPEIPQTDETQNLLKASRDNLCLDDLEGDMHPNMQASQLQEQEGPNNNKNFFFALEARQKWVKSLEKDEKWKKAELALLSKMKKILHNPYIEFPEQNDHSQIL